MFLWSLLMGEVMLRSQYMTIEGILWRTIQDLFIERLRCLVSWFVTTLSSMPWPKVSNEGAEVKVRCEVPRYANSTVLARDYQCQKLGLYGCCFCLGVVWVLQVAGIVWMMFVSLGLIWFLYVFVFRYVSLCFPFSKTYGGCPVLMLMIWEVYQIAVLPSVAKRNLSHHRLLESFNVCLFYKSRGGTRWDTWNPVCKGLGDILYPSTGATAGFLSAKQPSTISSI